MSTQATTQDAHGLWEPRLPPRVTLFPLLSDFPLLPLPDFISKRVLPLTCPVNWREMPSVHSFSLTVETGLLSPHSLSLPFFLPLSLPSSPLHLFSCLSYYAAQDGLDLMIPLSTLMSWGCSSAGVADLRDGIAKAPCFSLALPHPPPWLLLRLTACLPWASFLWNSSKKPVLNSSVAKIKNPKRWPWYSWCYVVTMKGLPEITGDTVIDMLTLMFLLSFHFCYYK